MSSPAAERLQLAIQAAQTQLLVVSQVAAALTPAIAAAEQRTAQAERQAAATERKLKPLTGADTRLITAAAGLLARLDTITTHGFACGEERAEREALRAVLVDLGAIASDEGDEAL